jgi:F-type H+-transporting ATPase subunit epsilon
VFRLTLVTPEKTIVKDAELAEITLPAHSGELNILPGHAELMTVLKAGRLNYRLQSGETADYVIAWGYCQVTDHSVLVLAESLKAKSELNITEIQSSLKLADKKLNEEMLNDEEYEKLIKQIEELRSQEFFVHH